MRHAKDSRQYHRRRGHPRPVRYFGVTDSSSHGSSISPFGGMPFRLARGYEKDYARPLSLGLGLGNPDDPRYQKAQGLIDSGQGPLAGYIRNLQSFLPGVFGQAQAAGTDIATRAPQLFGQFQSQIANLLHNELPNFQRHADESVNQAYSPIASQSLYQNALRQGLEGTRAGAAGRGLLDAGGTQAREEAMGRDLAAQYAQTQFQNQQTALGGAANLAQIGPQAAGSLFQMLPQLAQMLQAGYGIPMEALQSIGGILQGAQNPLAGLLQQVAPQIANASKSKGFNVL